MATTMEGRRLAPTPRLSDPMAALAAQDALLVGIGRAARRLLRSVPDLSQSERYLLQDLKRPLSEIEPEVRRPMKPLVSLVMIAARSTQPHDRVAVSEAVRAYELRLNRHEVQEIDPVLDQEDADNAAFNIAMRHWRRCPCAATWAVAVEAGERQAASTRAALDVLYANPSHGNAA